MTLRILSKKTAHLDQQGPAELPALAPLKAWKDLTVISRSLAPSSKHKDGAVKWIYIMKSGKDNLYLQKVLIIIIISKNKITSNIYIAFAICQKLF